MKGGLRMVSSDKKCASQNLSQISRVLPPRYLLQHRLGILICLSCFARLKSLALTGKILAWPAVSPMIRPFPLSFLEQNNVTWLQEHCTCSICSLLLAALKVITKLVSSQIRQMIINRIWNTNILNVNL